MKKLLALLLAVAMPFCFAGCGNANNPSSPDGGSQPMTRTSWMQLKLLVTL